MHQPRALQNSCQRRDDAGSRAWHRRIVLPIPNVARPEFTGAAAGDGQASAANQGIELAAEYLVRKRDSAAPARVVANIESSSRALVADHGNAGQSGKGVARYFGGKGIGGDKES